jgi:hypothetical protein
MNIGHIFYPLKACFLFKDAVFIFEVGKRTILGKKKAPIKELF